MIFAHPWFFALLVLVPVFVWWMLRKRRGSLRYSDLSFLNQAPNPGRWLRTVPVLLYSISLVFMIVALARPQHGRQYQEVETQGIDIMLCLDISGSMRAEDFKPDNRLAVAKNVDATLVQAGWIIAIAGGVGFGVAHPGPCLIALHMLSFSAKLRSLSSARSDHTAKPGENIATTASGLTIDSTVANSAPKLAWLRTTPLGRPVVPEV